MQQRLVAALRIVAGVRRARRELVDRRRKIREEAADARERFGFGRDLVVDRAIAGVYPAPAQRLLADAFTEAGHPARAPAQPRSSCPPPRAAVTRDAPGRPAPAARAQHTP